MVDQGPSHEHGEQHKAATAAYFNRMAAVYDEATAGSWRVNDSLVPILQEHLGIPLRAVLDVGAGTGQSLAPILAWSRPRRAVAVDPSEAMLDQLLGKFPQGVVAVHMSMDDYLAEAHERFDVVLGMGSLEFVPDIAGTVAGMCRRVGPDGLLVFTHEPLLPDTPGQHEPQTTFYPLKNEPDVSFTVFREDPARLHGVVDSYGFDLLHAHLLPAYQRGDHMVQYELIVAQRRLPGDLYPY